MKLRRLKVYRLKILGFACGLASAIGGYVVAQQVISEAASDHWDIGPGILALLGNVVTTGAGILILWLNQRAAFLRADEQRTEAKEEAIASAKHVASVLAEKVNSDTTKSSVKLDEIYTRVDGRLTKALEEIASLKTIIAGGGSASDRKSAALLAGPSDVMPTPPKHDRKGKKT